MEKHNNLSEIESPVDQNSLVTNFKNEIQKLSLKSLNLTAKKLNFLALELDPYDSMERPIEVENILTEYKLHDFLNNPFTFTNIVLQLLDTVETEIKTRSH